MSPARVIRESFDLPRLGKSLFAVKSAAEYASTNPGRRVMIICGSEKRVDLVRAWLREYYPSVAGRIEVVIPKKIRGMGADIVFNEKDAR